MGNGRGIEFNGIVGNLLTSSEAHYHDWIPKLDDLWIRGNYLMVMTSYPVP